MSSPTIGIGKRTFTVLFPQLLRPLSADERQALKNAIRKDGVQVPILVDDGDGIIDGINRATLAAELGLHGIRVDVRKGLSHEQKRELAVTLNDARRHLSEEDRAKIREERERRRVEKRRQGHSIRAIATQEQASIGQVQRDLKHAATVSADTTDLKPEKVTGKDGRTYPATRSAPPPDTVRQSKIDAFTRLWGQLNDQEKAFICQLMAREAGPATPG